MTMDRMREYIRLTEDALQSALTPRGETYEKVIRAMLYSASAGGKRIRPQLVLEFSRMCGGDVRACVPFAAAIEMIHTSSLIHDDLPCMDDDDLRRGRPSCHKQFDEATALLAGDALLLHAFELMTSKEVMQSGLSPQAIVGAVHILASYSGRHGMVGGQVIDLGMESGDIAFSQARLRQMDRLKTGALIKAACLMGVTLAGGNKEQLDAAEDYAAHLGQAFQIVDDILDVVGDEKALGKPIGSDAENDKKTYTSVYGIEGAKELAKEHTDAALQALARFADHEYLSQLTLSLLVRDH